MFKFYVNLADHDMVTDAGRTTMCRRKFRAHHSKQKVQKMKDLPRTWVLTVKQFEDFRRKKEQKQNSGPYKNPSGTAGPQRHELNIVLVNSKNLIN